MKRYSNTAVQTTITSAVNASATTIPVASTTGFPAVTFALLLDAGTVNEELVLVTGVAGLNLTVTRGYDNTTAVSHDAGATVQHSHSAEDFALSRTHEAATSAVHGVAGTLVGTSDTQTLTNKNLTSGTNTFPSTLTTASNTQTFTNKTIGLGSNVINGLGAQGFAVADASGNLQGSGKTVPTGTVVGATDTQTLTNKTLSVASNTINGLSASTIPLTDGTGKLSTSGKAIPSGTVVGTTDTQTLTNKTLTSPTITSPSISDPVISGVGYRAGVVKAADTARSNVATEADDPHLTLSIPAAGSYIIRGFLSIATGGTTGDISVRFTFPTGTLTFSGSGPHNSDLTGGSNANGEWVARSGSSSPSSSIPYGTSGSVLGVTLDGSLVATASGTLTLQWSQNVSNATATTVMAGSYLRIERVA